MATAARRVGAGLAPAGPHLVPGDPGGGVGPGAQLHITEALGRDPGRLIDIRVRVEELGAAGAIIAKRVAGTHLVRLENEES
ncbi:hypothetical protein OHA25_50255 [Nonomuraea sp. NBC_00507]|uniref:hypothetical protein n=1 Tax=Nonomuraea sp. NBC_00507 TaxID=2976002 RepID=UPI002E1739B5